MEEFKRFEMLIGKENLEKLSKNILQYLALVV